MCNDPCLFLPERLLFAVPWHLSLLSLLHWQSGLIDCTWEEQCILLLFTVGNCQILESHWWEYTFQQAWFWPLSLLATHVGFWSQTSCLGLQPSLFVSGIGISHSVIWLIQLEPLRSIIRASSTSRLLRRPASFIQCTLNTTKLFFATSSLLLLHYIFNFK